MKILKKTFTLTEIILAMAVIVLAVLPMIGLLTATSKVNYDNRKKNMISLLAARKMEELKNQGWMQKYAVTSSGNAKDKYHITQNLIEDVEFPQLSYAIENLTEPFNKPPKIDLRYAALARLGIAFNDKSSQLLETNGAFVSHTVNSGSKLTGVNLSAEQLQRYKNGGFFCVDAASPNIPDVIYSFNCITPPPPAQTYTLESVRHFYNGTMSSGNIRFLEKVILVPVTQRNKLYNFSNLSN